MVTVVVSSCSVNSAGFGRIKSVGVNWGPRYGHVPVHVGHMHGQSLRYIGAQNPAMHCTPHTNRYMMPPRLYEICHLLPWRWYEEAVQANNISGPSGREILRLFLNKVQNIPLPTPQARARGSRQFEQVVVVVDIAVVVVLVEVVVDLHLFHL